MEPKLHHTHSVNPNDQTKDDRAWPKRKCKYFSPSIFCTLSRNLHVSNGASDTTFYVAPIGLPQNGRNTHINLWLQAVARTASIQALPRQQERRRGVRDVCFSSMGFDVLKKTHTYIYIHVISMLLYKYTL